MSRPSPRVRLRRLLFLPLLLLVPLGALKWRADWIQDHPPLSKMDKKFQTIVHRFNRVVIKGSNPVWGEVTHLSEEQGIVLTDRKLIAQLIQTFRLGDEMSSPRSFSSSDDDIALSISDFLTATDIYFGYHRHEAKTGDPMIDVDDMSHNRVDVHRARMPSRFSPRFEALVSQFAQRAKAPGEHPGIVLKPWQEAY